MSFALGKKIGMTRVFDDSGNHIPVTLIQIGPCWITQVKTEETDGYNAVQVGFEPVREKSLNQPKLGHLKKASVEPVRHLKEFRLDGTPDFKTGQLLDLNRFEIGQRLTVTGLSKGRGFAGVFKRHGFHGPNASHGTHESKRHPGSIGAHTDPGKVWKGQRLPGQYGNEKITVKNLSLVKLIPEQNLILVKGAVPGARNSLVEIVLS